MKVCSTCKIEKPFNDFAKASVNLDGYRGQCNSCIKQWRVNNSKRLQEYGKTYRLNNSEKIKYDIKKWRLNNKEHIKEYDKIQNIIYYKKNSDKIKSNTKKWYVENKEKAAEYRKQYNIENKEKINEYKKEWIRIKLKTDSFFHLKHNTRRLIYMCLKNNGYSKTSKTFNILGCTPIEFKKHLEKQFTEGMTWENLGKWHLDHIYPISLAKDEEHLIKLNHYTNFQPLWAIDNIKKSNKILNG
jgi:hypothetical protein